MTTLLSTVNVTVIAVVVVQIPYDNCIKLIEIHAQNAHPNAHIAVITLQLRISNVLSWMLRWLSTSPTTVNVPADIPDIMLIQEKLQINIVP